MDPEGPHLLVQLCQEFKAKHVVEVGVRSGNLTARVLQNCPSVTRYYCVDPWVPYLESFQRPPTAAERDPKWWEMLYQRVVEMSKKDQRIVPVRMTSVAAAKKFAKKRWKVDIVYIDAIHDLENIVNDVYYWLPKLRGNGVLSGHDLIKSYKAMSEALVDIFQNQLNYWIRDPERPVLSYNNTLQGGNWWVFMNNRNKKYRAMVKKLYGDLLL